MIKGNSEIVIIQVSRHFKALEAKRLGLSILSIIDQIIILGHFSWESLFLHGDGLHLRLVYCPQTLDTPLKLDTSRLDKVNG